MQAEGPQKARFDDDEPESDGAEPAPIMFKPVADSLEALNKEPVASTTQDVQAQQSTLHFHEEEEAIDGQTSSIYVKDRVKLVDEKGEIKHPSEA